MTSYSTSKTRTDDIMIARDPAVHAHDHPTQPARRRRTHSTASTRSTPSNKRSPSPRITFTARPLSPDTKGVKNITRKVIKTLEGLGHLDSTDMDEQDDDYDSEQYDQREVEAVLNVHGSAKLGETPEAPVVLVVNGRPNGSVTGVLKSAEQSKKVDWEIPRKALHSSIGTFSLRLLHTFKSHLYLFAYRFLYIVPLCIQR